MATNDTTQLQNVIVIGIQLMFLLDVTAYRKVQQTEDIENQSTL